MLLGVHFDFRLCSKCAQQDASHVALFSLGGGQDPAPHLFGDQRMIPRELEQTAAAEQISAAVAYVSDTEFCVLNPHGRESRAHAVLFSVRFGGLEYISIGQ